MPKKKASTTASKLNANQQYAALTALSQATAARLLGMDSRSFRDRPDAPRNEDGTYSGPELVRWYAARPDAAAQDVGDDDFERLLLVASECISVEEGRLAAAIDTLDDLVARHGEASIARAFLRLLLEKARELREIFELPETPEQRAFHARCEAQERAKDRLQITFRCPKCRRVRVGRKWLSRRPAEGYAVEETTCPGCG